MHVTVTLTEDLATELTRRASRERRAPEVYASQLLGDALQQLGQADSWQDRNRRRLQLIRKGMTEQLEAAERAELDAEKEDEKQMEDQAIAKDEVVKRDFYMNEVLAIAADYARLLEQNRIAWSR